MKPLTYLLVDFENIQPPAQDIARVRGEDYRLWVFHGPHQNKFDADLVVAWQPLGDRVRFIQCSKSGKNALDFHIAFCLGQAQQKNAAAERMARYIVVTKDGGFDALFDYMTTMGCATGKAHSIPEALALGESLLPKVPAEIGGISIAASVSPPPTAQIDSKRVSAAAAASTEPVAKPNAENQPKKTAAKPAVLRSKMTPDDVKKVIADLVAHPANRPGDREALQRQIMTKLGNKVADQVILAVVDELELQGILTFNGRKIEYNLPKAKK